jgi:hypothetical protein
MESRGNPAIISTATFILLHCGEWDRVVALPRHKFVTGATLLQLRNALIEFGTQNNGISYYKLMKPSNRNYSAILATLLFAG